MAIPSDHRPHDPATVRRLLDDGLGQRNGTCGYGWPHAFDPAGCELDSVVEEDVTNATETQHEALEKMRQHAHQHGAIPSKWELLRAHADPTHPQRQALDAGHGALLNPITVAESTPAAEEKK